MNNRSARATGRRLTAFAAIAGLSMVGTVPYQNASACSIVVPPYIEADDLTQVLDTGGPIIDLDGMLPDGPPPTIVGAVRVEVIKVAPETVDWYSGAILQSTNLWGDADITPIEIRNPVLKTDADWCGFGNAPRLGQSFFSLSTQDGRLIDIVRSYEDNDNEIEAILDEQFGASVAVPEESEGSATADFSGGGGTLEHSRPSSRTVRSIAVIAGTLIVGICIGLLLSRRIRLRR